MQIAASVSSVACKALMELSSSAVRLVWRWSIGTYAETLIPHSEYTPYPAISPTVGCFFQMKKTSKSTQTCLLKADLTYPPLNYLGFFFVSFLVAFALQTGD